MADDIRYYMRPCSQESFFFIIQSALHPRGFFFYCCCCMELIKRHGRKHLSSRVFPTDVVAEKKCVFGGIISLSINGCRINR